MATESVTGANRTDRTRATNLTGGHYTLAAFGRQFERDIIIERTQAGLARAKAEGIKLGRKPALTDKQRADVRTALESGATVYALAKQYGTTRQTIMRVRNGGVAEEA